MQKYLLLLPLLAAIAGCPVTQSQDTPVSANRVKDAGSGSEYWIYVPSTYDSQNKWPLVITLHGTHGWDSSTAQMMEWKALAEEKGFIVVAPSLKSVQGILPVPKNMRMKDLASDDKTIMSVLDRVCRDYSIDERAVLLTGFSAGGYPLWYTGLRHPDRFNMLIAHNCNSDINVFEGVPLNDAVRKMRIMIFWGRDDLMPINEQSWQAVRWLREHRCFNTEYRKVDGGHLRRPELAYSYWEKILPKEEIESPEE